mmetsp:Transcript_117368/g.332123  ORF Transcript_117368/g.332123 Transcript_117368/m.332123 type:complete len:92 (+) Transcript_117368:376-651(+)
MAAARAHSLREAPAWVRPPRSFLVRKALSISLEAMDRVQHPPPMARLVEGASLSARSAPPSARVLAPVVALPHSEEAQISLADVLLSVQAP